mmetsp:Transcript_19559/g.36979  ORF Transcript_19559/g.36979 Transcript_19559/m.36979 type:complete len:89 (+) Transcript_19559:333-599(+)
MELQAASYFGYEHGFEQCVELVVDAESFNIDCQTAHGEMTWHLTCSSKKGPLPIVSCLMARGADILACRNKHPCTLPVKQDIRMCCIR